MTNNKTTNKRRILVAVLNWGLGHATRTIPIIKKLSKNHTVIIASTGRSLALLKREFPNFETLDFPDYNIRYCRNGKWLLPYLFVQIPGILVALLLERLRTAQIVKRHSIDMIFSDNRYGVYSKKIPSYFMTHQLRFRLTKGLRKIEILSVWFNQWVFRKYRHVFIPDISGDINLTGQLGHVRAFLQNPGIEYIGFLSSVELVFKKETIDALIVISGPEPQRTALEELVLNQLQHLTGHCVIVLGRPEVEQTRYTQKGHEIYSHVDRSKMSEFMSSAKIIVARAGYSTVMEIIALKKHALFIPTPGQTEQMYISERLSEGGFFHCVVQEKLMLSKDLAIAAKKTAPENLAKKTNNLSGMMKIMGLDS